MFTAFCCWDLFSGLLMHNLGTSLPLHSCRPRDGARDRRISVCSCGPAHRARPPCPRTAPAARRERRGAELWSPARRSCSRQRGCEQCWVLWLNKLRMNGNKTKKAVFCKISIDAHIVVQNMYLNSMLNIEQCSVNLSGERGSCISKSPHANVSIEI